jgi:hypothetical protein
LQFFSLLYLLSLLIVKFNIDHGGNNRMDVARKLGILVFCAVPAVVGGGIVYAAFGSLPAIFIYEVMLLLGVGAFISR